MIQPIIMYGSAHNVLKTKTKISNVQDDKELLTELITNMKDTLTSVGGLGLAANQIGRDESVCIVRLGSEIISMINPTITRRFGDEKISTEGCLSLPDVSATVTRSENIEVTFVNPDKNWQEETIQIDFPNSVIVQHEVDHLNGILMIDYLSPFEKTLISTKLKRISRGNVEINYVGMIWRHSQRSWSLVGPYIKLIEFYNQHSTTPGDDSKEVLENSMGSDG
jgi:peptide deformylase